MVVNQAGPAPDHRGTPGLLVFARLKLRILGNGFRGRPGKVALFVLGLLAGIGYGGFACVMLIVSYSAGEPELAALVPPFAGTLLVLGWLLLPLVWFGVDDTLDPARFALLPLPRRALLRGLLMGALVGVPALATVLALLGLPIGAAIAGGPIPALVAAVGAGLGVLLCVLLSRAVTSGFSRALRARRTRDLAAVVLAVLVASIGPIQVLLTTAGPAISYGRLESIAQTLAWTPLAAPFVVGADAMEGRWLAVGARLAITVVTILLLLRWWSSSLESAMLGAAGSSGPTKISGELGTATARLFRRSRRPRTPYGAMVVRELRYWVRDARRRANLITFAVVAVFVPVIVNLSSPTDGRGDNAMAMAMAMVGTLAALGLANQFGFDGTSYATQLVIGVPGRLELRSRVVAYSWLVAPILLVLIAAFSLVRGTPEQIPVLLGVLAGGYGASIACTLHVSVLGAYAMPENQNPFAINTGTGVVKSLLAMVAWVGGILLAVPLVLLVVLGGSVGSALALPVGLAYGLGAIWLGLVTAGDVLDRRQPEVLQAVTPRN